MVRLPFSLKVVKQFRDLNKPLKWSVLYDDGIEKYPIGKETVWRSGTVMDCHATALLSIPGGNGDKTELYVLRNGQ